MEQKIQLSQVLHEQRRYSSAKCSKTKSRGGVGVGFKSGKNALPGGGGKGRKGGLHCNWKDKIRRLTHNGTSLQYSCLENPMDGGAWWAAVHAGREELDTTERLHFPFSLSCIGEGNGTPLQCSCLENPRDGGAWWAAIYGVAQSRTRLKRLSSSSNIQS